MTFKNSYLPSINGINQYLDVSKTNVKHDFTGEKFGILTVLGYLGTLDGKKCMWEVKCDCGNLKQVQTGVLKKSLSCGCIGYNKKPKGEAAFNNIVSMYKKSARDRNLEFSLTNEQFKKLIDNNCALCGVNPSNEHKIVGGNGSYIYSGIDRVDNNIGYIMGNCVTLCKQCNFAKRNLKVDDFYEWINRLIQFRGVEHQPVPVSNNNPPVVDLVVEDLQKRKRLGLLRYKKFLQANNGRDTLQDLYEELQDAVIYIKGVLEERK